MQPRSSLRTLSNSLCLNSYCNRLDEESLKSSSNRAWVVAGGTRGTAARLAADGERDRNGKIRSQLAARLFHFATLQSTYRRHFLRKCCRSGGSHTAKYYATKTATCSIRLDE